jgi:hypothetical protein
MGRWRKLVNKALENQSSVVERWTKLIKSAEKEGEIHITNTKNVIAKL